MARIITDLGRVMPVYRGNWSSTTTYQKLDYVIYNNNTYIGITTNIEVGILPTNTQYWGLFAPQGQQGEKGEQGDIGPTGPTGNIYYTTFDIDFTDGILYANYDADYNGPTFDIDNEGFLGVTV